MQLTLLLLGLSAAAQADDRIVVNGHVYTDSMGVLVTTPAARVERDLAEGVTLSGKVVTDAITAASRQVDGVSSATLERRGAGTLSLGVERGTQRFSGLVEHSSEPDYRSSTVGLGWARDFASRCTTLELYGWAAFDKILPVRIGRDDAAVEDKRTQSLRVSFSQVLNRSAVASASYEIMRVRGYQESPYYADIVALSEDATLAVQESHPELRTRHSLALRLDQWLPTRGALHPSVRLYADDWGVRSVTAELAYSQHLGEWLISRVRYRGYAQSATSWYQDSYAAAVLDDESFVTLDYKYDQLTAHLGSVQLLLDLEPLRAALALERLDAVSMHGTYTYYHQVHDDWAFGAHVAQVGLTTRY